MNRLPSSGYDRAQQAEQSPPLDNDGCAIPNVSLQSRTCTTPCKATGTSGGWEGRCGQSQPLLRSSFTAWWRHCCRPLHLLLGMVSTSMTWRRSLDHTTNADFIYVWLFSQNTKGRNMIVRYCQKQAGIHLCWGNNDPSSNARDFHKAQKISITRTFYNDNLKKILKVINYT